MSQISEENRNRVILFCLMTLSAIAVAFSIYWLRPVLVPFVVAVFVVSGLAPILDFLEQRLHVNRMIAAGIAFLFGLIMLILLFGLIWMSIVELDNHAAEYKARFNEIWSKVEGMLPHLNLLDSLPEHQDAVTHSQSNSTNSQTYNTNESAPKEKSAVIKQMVNQGITQITDTLLTLLSQSVVVLIYVFFLLLGASERMLLNSTWKEIDLQIRSYLVLKTNISLVTGFVFGLILWMYDVPMAITFGLLAFLLNYIPNIGPLVASVLPMPLIVLHPDLDIVAMTSVISLTVLVQFISGNVVEPKIMGNSSDLHPVVVLLALMFWGMLWGIVGMFLATPITAGIKIVLERIEVTRPIALVMSGRWPEQA